MLEIESLQNQIFLLRLKLDEEITSGKCFKEVRKIYAEIKETERAVAASEARLKNNKKLFF